MDSIYQLFDDVFVEMDEHNVYSLNGFKWNGVNYDYIKKNYGNVIEYMKNNKELVGGSYNTKYKVKYKESNTKY